MRKHYPLNSQGAEDAGKLPWIDGVPSTGVEGSYPGQALFVDTEAEILAAIDASGQARNGSDLTQLIQAFARGVYLGQFAGTANALAAAIPNNVVFASLLRGIKLTGSVTATNTAGVTVAVTGFGLPTAPATVTAPLLRRNGTALQSGDLPVGQDFEIRWDGSAFRMVGSVASDSGSSGTGGTTNFVILRDVKPNGTGGGYFASGAFYTRDLNTMTDDPSGQATAQSPWVTLNNGANSFTLQPGKYFIDGRCPANTVDSHIAALMTTGALTTPVLRGRAVNGTAPTTTTPDVAEIDALFDGELTLSVATTFVVRHRCQTTGNSGPSTPDGTWAWGVPSTYLAAGLGPEQYTRVLIRKDV